MWKHWNKVQKDQTTQLWSNLIKTDASGNIKVNLLHIRASPVWLLRLCCLVTCCVTAEFRVNKKAELRARRALFFVFFCLLSSEWLRLSQFVSDEAEQHRIHLFVFFSWCLAVIFMEGFLAVTQNEYDHFTDLSFICEVCFTAVDQKQNQKWFIYLYSESTGLICSLRCGKQSHL